MTRLEGRHLERSWGTWEAWVVRPGCGRNVGTLSAVSVLVGDVVDGVDHSVWAGVRVRSLHDLGLSRGSGVLQEATLLGTDSVAGFVAVDVRTVRVGLVHLVQDDGSSLRASVRNRSQRHRKRANLGGCGSDDSGEDNHLQKACTKFYALANLCSNTTG